MDLGLETTNKMTINEIKESYRSKAISFRFVDLFLKFSSFIFLISVSAFYFKVSIFWEVLGIVAVSMILALMVSYFLKAAITVLDSASDFGASRLFLDFTDSFGAKKDKTIPDYTIDLVLAPGNAPPIMVRTGEKISLMFFEDKDSPKQNSESLLSGTFFQLGRFIVPTLNWDAPTDLFMDFFGIGFPLVFAIYLYGTNGVPGLTAVAIYYVLYILSSCFAAASFRNLERHNLAFSAENSSIESLKNYFLNSAESLQKRDRTLRRNVPLFMRGHLRVSELVKTIEKWNISK